MNSENRTKPSLDLAAHPELARRYTLRSPALKYEGTVLTFQKGKSQTSYDLADLYLPPTPSQPRTTCIADYPEYVDICLAAADMRLEKATKGLPAARTISRQLYLIRNVLDWLRHRGIYNLSEASAEAIKELIQDLAQGGWNHALRLEDRWKSLLNHIESNSIDLSTAFHFRSQGGKRCVETLRRSFWSRMIGWGGVLPLTASAKKQLQKLIPDWPTTRSWQERKIPDISGPSVYVLRNMMGWINNLAALPASVDRLQHRASYSTNASAKRMAKKKSSRTANLEVNVAIRLFKEALALLYEVAPLLVQLLDDATAIYPTLSPKKKSKWLSTSIAREKLENHLGKPALYWMRSGNHPRSNDDYCVDEILSAVQGACAIILAAMNARRQREVCDRELGIRVGDLIVLDESLGLYQCWFYIEKTYRERHLFYVNQCSADALKCLERLKLLCTPFEFHANHSLSLFQCGRLTELGATSLVNFAFTEDNGRTRSLISFLKYAYGPDEATPSVASHMFRRFFAILYFHRYEHAELRALKQHLRHLDVAMTRVYVTDPASRPLAEQIQMAWPENSSAKRSDDLNDSLGSDMQDMLMALEEMSEEKLEMAVEEILNGEPTGGGFSKVVRKLYKKMTLNLTIDTASTGAATKKILNILKEHHYQVTPMHHGQCHAPVARRTLKGKCEKSGVLQHELASAHTCGSCAFHYNNAAYMENLKEDLADLSQDMDNFLLPPVQQQSARSTHRNLQKLIMLSEEKMFANALAVNEISSTSLGARP